MSNSSQDDALLASVSRSFYLTIKALPGPVRGPVGLAYLLARATDTIADSSDAEAGVRLRHLDALRRMIGQGSDPAALELIEREIVPADSAERTLIGGLGRCLERLAAASAADRTDIADVLGKITRGQELDLVRFSGAGGGALTTSAELDEYTYLVAGCVGEFWTRLCFRLLPGFTKLNEEAMRALGVNFGKGLQLVNILRDLPADLKAGRCYLPLGEAGLDAEAVRRSPQLCRAVTESWLAMAVAHLDDAHRYIRAISNRRLRYACILPWHLGMQTLILLREKPPLEAGERIKVSRGDVKVLMLKAFFWAQSNFLLRIERDRLARAYYCRTK